MYAVLAVESLTGLCSNTESTMDDRDSLSPLHTNRMSNSAILSNNYVSLLNKLCTCIQVKKMAPQMKPLLFSDVWSTSWDFKVVKKQWADTLLSVKCCCFVRKPSRKSHTILNQPVWRRRKKTFWQLSGLVLLWYLLTPLSMLFIMKTLEDEPYILSWIIHTT